MHYRSLLALFVAACCSPELPAQYAGAVPVSETLSAGFKSIEESDSQSLLTTLVSEEFSGRGTGQEGYFRAANWVADRLKENGFQPAAADGSWFQNVPFVRVKVIAEDSSVKMGEAVLASGSQIGMNRYSGRFDQELPVAFVRLGEQRPQIADGALGGQLLVVAGQGRLSIDDPWIQAAKPACVLFVVPQDRLRTESVNRVEESPVELPCGMIAEDAANKLAASAGVSADLLKGDNPLENVLVQTTRRLRVLLAIERESLDIPNVVAWYPGADESLRHEHIAIGAHLDHLGVQRGEVFPGADDNGSGSAAILQIAKAIHLNPVKPKRSVLFLAFCAEERGLLGSKYYAENPVKPLEDMICMLNIDMIGRNEETAEEPAADNENTIHLIGSKQISEQLHNLVMEANQHVGFVFEYDEERVYTRSDHASFAARGVPVTFLFGGFNPHYHKTTDTLDGINFGKIANAARLNYLTLMLVAEHGPLPRNPTEEKKPE